MEKKFKIFLEENNLINSHLAVAVSTGVDSMVLLSLLLKFEVDITVVHINHQVRAESIKEEEYIKAFCFERGIKCFIKRLDFSDFKNFQENARNLRYAYFEEVLKSEGIKHLCLAHHANDQMETIIMRILRGASLGAIVAMSKISPYKDIVLVRPLLDFTKDEIVTYATKEKIIYFEDASNEKDIYTRNRIRKNILPALFAENKKAGEKFMEFSASLNLAYSCLEKEINLFKETYVKFEKDYFSFSIKAFLNLSLEFKQEVLFNILKEKDLSKQNINEIIKILNTDKANLKVDYLDFTILKEYDKASIFYKRLVLEKVDLEIAELKEYNIDDKRTVKISKIKSDFNSNLYNLCYNIHSLPLIVRNKSAGDKIKTSGGTKLLNKLFIDLKVDYLKREKALVVVDNKGVVLLVVGYKKSEILNNNKGCDCIVEFKEKK